ncbi:MAG TPA: hypothetical protein VFF78_00240, partial [Anaerolineaceae bacterium]|nr:hypothetical protein [Anaerolineaceae bacterium]
SPTLPAPSVTAEQQPPATTEAATQAPQFKINPSPLTGLGLQLVFDMDGIVILDIDSGEFTQLTQHEGSYHPPRWAFSPDGEQILYAAKDANGTDNFQILSPSSQSQVTLRSQGMNLVPALAWHPGGHYVLVSNTLFDAQDGDMILPIGGEAYVFRNSFSADGLHIAMVIPGDWVLLRADLNLDAAGNLVGLPTNIQLCVLRPDRLDCHDYQEGAYADILVELQSEEVLPIADADWSPQGDTLALLANNGIYLLNSADNVERILAENYLQQIGLVEQGWSILWSPDGAKISFSGTSNFSASKVFVIDVQENVVTEITNEEYPASNYPAWSPDSQWLVYSIALDGSRLVLSRADGSEHILLSSDIWSLVFELHQK